MGKAKDSLLAFIEDIPESKFSGFPVRVGTIYSTHDFRLDMQSVRTLYFEYLWQRLKKM